MGYNLESQTDYHRIHPRNENWKMRCALRVDDDVIPEFGLQWIDECAQAQPKKAKPLSKMKICPKMIENRPGSTNNHPPVNAKSENIKIIIQYHSG